MPAAGDAKGFIPSSCMAGSKFFLCPAHRLCTVGLCMLGLSVGQAPATRAAPSAHRLCIDGNSWS